MIHRWARSERGLSIVGGLHHSSVVVEPEGHITSTVPGRRRAALSPEGGDGCIVVALVGAGQPASFAACPVTSSPGGCRTRPPLGGSAFTPFPRCTPPRTTASQVALGRGVFPALEPPPPPLEPLRLPPGAGPKTDDHPLSPVPV